MPLLKLDNVSLHYGNRVLLDGVELTLRKGNRIGLLGRNGEGKTTLLRVVAGEATPDSGERWLRPGVRIATLDQSLPEGDDTTVYDKVAEGLEEAGRLLSRYHHLVQDPAPDLDALEKVQHQLEAVDGWSLQQRVDKVLTQLDLPADVAMKTLSGGWRRRVALARALVVAPDILILDEPTNHLDIPSIEWLEKQLREFRGALLLVTHDRAFLQRSCNAIVELDRGHLHGWDGDYHSFEAHRAERLAAEERAEALFDKRLAEEEKWIRQGIKARRTRNQGRVRSLEAMRRQQQERRQRQGTATFDMEQGGASGRLVAELKNVSHSFEDRTVIRDFSTLVMRGDRIGIVGPNGAGKSTLLKIILGELMPEQGEVKLGTKLEVAYFDQLRQKLDPAQTLMDNICGGREFVTINGKDRHGISYLGDFLFTPEKARTPVRALSGGEQNRAILAKLFSKPANVLVLDEPTNDLDIETLELLEDILMDFDGTLLLVSHDRAFMDNVVTSLLVFEGGGVISDHVGGYSDWAARGNTVAAGSARGEPDPVAPAPAKPVADKGKRQKGTKKLSYKVQRELDALPGEIEHLEQAMASLEAILADPDFYQRDKGEVDAAVAEAKALQEKLEEAYNRWQALESS